MLAEPLLTQDGHGIIYPRTINFVQGQTGAHKSRVVELITSVLIAQEDLSGDMLGYALGPAAERPCAVCYVDTERNQQEQFAQAIQQIKARAGYDYRTHPAHFEYISLLTVPRAERLKVLEKYLQRIRGRMSGHLLVVLDQLADCVADFNDPTESMLLTDLLNVLVNQQDMTFLCVIHENPGRSKARGHLGTEMANKASTVLQIGFVKLPGGAASEVVQLHYIKRRSGAPGLKFYARYDAETKGLVRTAAETRTTRDDLRDAQTARIIAELGTVLTTRLSKTELKNRLRDKVQLCAKTVGGELTDLVAKRTLVANAAGEACHLQEEKSGTKITCWLEPAS